MDGYFLNMLTCGAALASSRVELLFQVTPRKFLRVSVK